MSWPCFWVEETGDVELRLRRWAGTGAGGPCLGSAGYHHASSEPVGRRSNAIDADGIIGEASLTGYGPRHASWPKRCEGCEYVFVAADHRQVAQARLYRRPGTAEEWTERTLPPGAMFDCAWLPDAWRGPDGIALTVVTPGKSGDARAHFWHVDGPAGQHPAPAWSRTGDPRAEPPTVVASPSILTPDYHGFLVLDEGRSTLTDSGSDRPL